METVGLKGIWGYEQLDRTGITTWKLGFMFIAAGTAMGYVFNLAFSGIAPNPVLGAMSQTPLFFMWVIITGFVALYLTMARATEGDLTVLASLDATLDGSIAKLNPSRLLLTTTILFQLLLTFLVGPVLISTGPFEPSIIEAIIAILGGGHQLIFTFIISPVLGLTLGVGTAIAIKQIISLTHAARHIKIDLLHLNDYAAIAEPLVRLFLYLIPIMSTLPLMMLFIENPREVAGIAQVALIFTFFCAAVLLAYAYPIWVLRNRIKEAKESELNLVTRSLRGDKEAIRKINIHSLEAPTSATDLLTHQMFLESRWDWPIASHVQKLLVFGLLPPFTWMLAAVIENTMY